MKKICFLLLLLAICIGLSLSGQKSIKEIYVGHASFGQTYPEYKIDLQNKQLWKYDSDWQNYVERDRSAVNEGYTFAGNLEDEKTDAFLDACERSGFAYWKESYVDERVFDGHQWKITITFSDSSQRHTFGSNAYPETWNMMFDAFKALTGKNILVFYSEHGKVWSNQ